MDVPSSASLNVFARMSFHQPAPAPPAAYDDPSGGSPRAGSSISPSSRHGECAGPIRGNHAQGGIMRRRLVAIFAAVALGVTALAGAAPASAADESPVAAYVALGDSEAAGTGNLPYADT